MTFAYACLTCGCASTSTHRNGDPSRGYVYYLDGAGGGNLIFNWGRGVKTGFEKAGYDGAGEQFSWQTGLGPAADQAASDDYKRKKAAELAEKIQENHRAYSGAPITLIGLSAGTAITLFTLEALPESFQVENVVLLGASVSADYDLTEALSRVRNRMYVFTSENDEVLKFLVPIAGTADRGSGQSQAAGLRGFIPPTPVSAETRSQYTKLVHIDWSREFAAEGARGGHTDTVNSKFVQTYIAPLVMKATPNPRSMARGSVENPDFRRWSDFGPGSSLTMEGYQVVEGRREPLRITGRLIHKWDDKLYLERTLEPMDRDSDRAPLVRGYFEWARIDPSSHPLTNRQSTITELPPKSFEIQRAGTVVCSGRTGTCKADFVDWGKNPTATVYSNPTVPGGIVNLEIKAIADGREIEYYESVVDYHRVTAVEK